MKIAYLSEGDIHTAKWLNSLSDMGHEIHLIVMEPLLETFEADIKLFREVYETYKNETGVD